MDSSNTLSSPLFQLSCLGDHALLFSLPSSIDPLTLHQISELSEFIHSLNIKCIRDVIPSYHTVTIIYDIRQLYLTFINEINIHSPLQLGNELIQFFTAVHANKSSTTSTSKIIKMPVCYDPIFGIDLTTISFDKKISCAEIIKLHSDTIYTVYCLGFMPGFAYMGSVPEKIKTPRHSKPRAKVLAGSIGIAGAQTGIYPMNSPGGWQLIGRTPIKTFDDNVSKLATLKMGNRVKFYPISIDEFNATNEHS